MSIKRQITLPGPIEGGAKNRSIWNVYKKFRKNIYYYHTFPMDNSDILFRKNINPDEMFDMVQHYNKNENKL